MNASNPLVTVYIPTFNRCKLLKRAVESVRNQTYKNLEIIIVDDCSNDGTHDYLKETAALDNRIHYFIKEKNSGACVSRNIALNNAKGEYLTGLDDDDYYDQYHLEKMLLKFKSLKSEKVAVFPSAGAIVDGKIIPLKQSLKIVTLAHLKRKNFIGNQILTLKKNFQEVSGFDVNMPAWQDYDVWFRMASKGITFYKSEEITYYYDAGDNFTVRISNGNKIRKAYELFIAKNMINDSLYAKKRMELNYYAYPQINMNSSQLLSFFRFFIFLRPIKIFMLKKINKILGRKVNQTFT